MRPSTATRDPGRGVHSIPAPGADNRTPVGIDSERRPWRTGSHRREPYALPTHARSPSLSAVTRWRAHAGSSNNTRMTAVPAGVRAHRQRDPARVEVQVE